jgi:hypothetical protein
MTMMDMARLVAVTLLIVLRTTVVAIDSKRGGNLRAGNDQVSS